MVEVFTTTADFLRARAAVTSAVGFVPTMGNLHAGHLSLLEAGLAEFEVICFSIFVNPKQFGPNEDFNRYPRTLKDDISLIERSLQKFPNRRVLVYAPSDPQEVFPENSGQKISVANLSEILEGAIRPGHFDGVTTVVYRLFELVRPQRAWFGLKDYQQYVVIRQMVRDLALPVSIVGMPIVREESGLALSSRNQYLSAEQKELALHLSRSLREVATLLNGERKNLPAARRRIDELLLDKNWNYLELRDAENLSADLGQSERVVLLAVYQLGSTRLLDNLLMELR